MTALDEIKAKYKNSLNGDVVVVYIDPYPSIDQYSEDWPVS